MPSRSVARVLAALTMASAVSWLGCGGGGSDIIGPAPGSLDVTIATSGPEPDPDGYTVSIDGAAAEAIGINASRHTEDLAPGNHTVTLAGLAGNCTVGGTGAGVTVEILTGAASAVRFDIACVATTGTIEVVTTTAGSPADPDGYELQLDGGPALPIGAGASVSMPAVLPGPHSVGLAGLAGNCTVDGDNPRPVTVTAGVVAPVAFTITCTALAPTTGSIAITVATSGADQDPDGYELQLDGGAAQLIGSGTTVSIPGVTPGAHSVKLGGLSGNCAPVGDNPRPLTVIAGQMTAVAFTVACTAFPPTTGSIAVTIATTGAEPDPDGYALRIDQGDAQSIGVNGTVSVHGLAAGSHSVLLQGTAPNCAIGGDNPREIAVVAGQTATTTINVTCTATTGALKVTVTGLPGGTNADVTVTGPGGFNRAVTATTTLPDLVPGSYTVTAAEVTSGNTPYAPTPRSRVVPVAAAATAGAAVAYAATPPSLNLRIDGWFLTQSVQSAEGDVPLVENRDGFLRVFVLADGPNTATPKVRVRMYLNGSLERTFDIPAPGPSTPQSRNEDDLASSWNVKVPHALFAPGLTVLADVDPANSIGETNEADNSYPVSGAAAAEPVRAVPALGIRLVPVRQQTSGLTGDVSSTNKASFLDLSRRMLPIAASDGDLHQVYTTTTANPLLPDDANLAWLTILGELNALRIAEGSSRSYYGVVRLDYASGIAGLGYIGLPTAMGYDRSGDRSRVMAHEMGHTFGRLHAPCGQPGQIDPDYPHFGGLTGTYGYDLQADVLKSPFLADIMGYCADPWISDYTYEGVLAFRTAEQNAVAAAAASAPQRCLLVWGRIVDGRAVLEPAFEIVTRPSLPKRSGPYSVDVTGADGSRLFSLSFDAAAVEDGRRGARQFAFAVPLGGVPGEQIGSLRLSGPGANVAAARAQGAPGPQAAARAAAPAIEVRAVAGGVSLRWDATAQPMVMVRDPETGEVLSFARGGQASIATSRRTLDLVLSDRVGSRQVRVTARQ